MKFIEKIKSVIKKITDKTKEICNEYYKKQMGKDYEEKPKRK